VRVYYHDYTLFYLKVQGESMNPVSVAQRWLQAGFSVLPVHENKRPDFSLLPKGRDGKPSWEPLRTKPYDFAEVGKVFDKAEAVAVITGYGGLYLFDFDTDKKGNALGAFNLEQDFLMPWLAETEHQGIKVVHQQTPSGGWHFPVVCPEPLGNQKLARVPGKKEPQTTIETRGVGGYFLVYDENLNPATIPNLTQGQFERLLEAAMELDRCEFTEEDKKQALRRRESGKTAHASQKGDVGWFNERYTVKAVLERNGYKRIRDKYLSPHSASGNAGVVVFEDPNGLELCVSYHNEILGDGHAHDAFDVFKIVEHGGDFHKAIEAVRALKGQGRFTFGTQPSRAYPANSFASNDRNSVQDEKTFDARGSASNRTNLALNSDPEHEEKSFDAKNVRFDAKNFEGLASNEMPSRTAKTPFDAKNAEGVRAREEELAPNDGGEEGFDANPLKTRLIEEAERQERASRILKWGQRPKPKPVTWLVKDLFQENSENLLGGEPGVGKSWVTTELAVCVATGTAFLGRTTAQGPVLFVNFDDPSESLARSFFERSARGKEYDPSDLDVYYWQPDISKPYPPNGILNEDVFDELKKFISLVNVRLTIVDAFSSCFPSLDGNKAQDVIAAFEALRQLRISSGAESACTVLVDHTPKQTMLDSKRRGISGSQQKHARARTVHIISKIDPSEVGGDDVIQWEVFKANAAPYQEPFGIQREVDTLMNWSSLEVRGLPSEQKAPQQKRALRAALMHLQSHAGGVVHRQELIKAVIEVTNASKRTVENALSSSEFIDHPNVQQRNLGGKGNAVGYFWFGEVKHENEFYIKLRLAVFNGRWQIGNLEALKDMFQKADAGDKEAKEKIEAYLEHESVKASLD
jgi:hypothetical protein